MSHHFLVVPNLRTLHSLPSQLLQHILNISVSTSSKYLLIKQKKNKYLRSWRLNIFQLKAGHRGKIHTTSSIHFEAHVYTARFGSLAPPSSRLLLG